MKGQVVWILFLKTTRPEDDGPWVYWQKFTQSRTTLFEKVNSKQKLAKLSRVPTSYVPWKVMGIFEQIEPYQVV